MALKIGPVFIDAFIKVDEVESWRFEGDASAMRVTECHSMD